VHAYLVRRKLKPGVGNLVDNINGVMEAIDNQSLDKWTSGRTGTLVDETFDLVSEPANYDTLRSCYLIGVIGGYCIDVVVWSVAASPVLVVGIATS